MEQYLIAVCALAGLASSGCVIPYVYPYVDSTREIPASMLPKDTRFFRVEYEGSRLEDCYGAMQFGRIEELKQSDVKQAIPPQSRLSLARGIILWFPALSHDFGNDERVDIRLYRRGFKTAVITRFWDGDPFDWIPASAADDREEAIDTVMFGPIHHVVDVRVARSLAPQCTAPVAGWAVAEYEAVAKDPGISEIDKKRILAKVEYLQSPAAKG